MKLDFNKRYFTIAKYVVLTIFLVMLCILGFVHSSSVWKKIIHIVRVFLPIFYGAIIAYLLCPGVKFFERRVFRGLNRKKLFGLSRVLSVISIFLIVIAFIVIFCWLVLPRVFAGYADLQMMSEMYVKTLKEWLLGISFGDNAFSAYLTKFVEYFVGLLEKLYVSSMAWIPDVMTLAGSLVSVLKDILLGIILSVYFLLARERLLAQMKKVLRAFLNTEKYRVFAKSSRLADKNLGGYVKGQLADALVIGVLSYFCLLIMGIPYYPLVSSLVGIASLIPVFGTLIGIVVGALIIFLANPLASLGFVLFMLILHLINQKMIRPYIVRVGVDASTMFMFAAMIIMTGLIGLWGLVIGVPIFVILYTLLHSAVDKRLAQKGLSTEPISYYETKAGKELYQERESKRLRMKRGEKEDHGEKEDFRLKDADSSPLPETRQTDSQNQEHITFK